MAFQFNSFLNKYIDILVQVSCEPSQLINLRLLWENLSWRMQIKLVVFVVMMLMEMIYRFSECFTIHQENIVYNMTCLFLEIA